MTDCNELILDIPFSLKETLGCGQVFRWVSEEDGWYRGIASGQLLKVRQDKNVLRYCGCTEEFLINYFHLDADLDKIISTFDKDEYIHAAIEKHAGLRIIRQDPWECMLTYLCAQNANIPFISRMLQNLSDKYGSPVSTDFGCAKCYPTPESLSGRCKEEIGICSTGYRSAYILSTAEKICMDPGWAERIQKADYETARKEIMRYDGIGPKVADCILLFGFRQYESFPVDRWVDRVMHKYYGIGDPERPLSTSEYNRIGEFGREYFGKYAGYAQEYLFADR